jgi:hypothetical protein
MISPCLSPVSPFNFIKEILCQTEGYARARHDSVVRRWNNTNKNPPTFLFFSSPRFPFPLLFRPLPPIFILSSSLDKGGRFACSRTNRFEDPLMTQFNWTDVHDGVIIHRTHTTHRRTVNATSLVFSFNMRWWRTENSTTHHNR